MSVNETATQNVRPTPVPPAWGGGGGAEAAKLFVSQRDVDKCGSQPVGITLYFYVVGFRVNINEVMCLT